MRIHFIGICGVAMSALAIAFRKKGWQVTGSDVGFYPPISTYLKESDIEFYPGWHVEKMIKNGKPDIVVVGNVAGSQNPEWFYAQKHNLNFKSYPEVIAEYFVKQNSIVCAGTYGKTSSSALLSWILTHAGFEPNYMFGGLATNNFDSANITSPVIPSPLHTVPFHCHPRANEDPCRPMNGLDSTFQGNANVGDWSILEGDEYKSASWDNRPKFAHYSPTHLLLTSVSWDHADIYPFEDDYINEFKNLVGSIPKNGLIIACADGPNVERLIAYSLSPVATYGRRDADYTYTGVRQNHQGLSFQIEHGIQSFNIMNPMIGEYQAENICGCFAMTNEIGVSAEKIIEAISTFKGLKRRLEKRHEGAVTVIDDIAHSPSKAKSALQTLRQIYKGKIFAIFEPNIGNRRPQSAPSYSHAFDNADEVVIPTLTKLKTDPKDPDKPLDGEDLAKVISATHPNVLHIHDDEDLITRFTSSAKQGDVIVFLGSHGFRGMIDNLIKTITSLPQ